MSLKTLWLDARELKGLRTDIEYLDAEELKKELDAAIEEMKEIIYVIFFHMKQ